MKYKAICFDIDGTLYPKAVMNRRLLALGFLHPHFSLCYNKMRKQLRQCQESLQGNLISKEATVIVKNSSKCKNQDIKGETFLAEVALVKERLEKWIYAPMQRLYKKTKPYDGVVETFKTLKAKGLKIGVFSDFPLFKKLQSMGLEPYVDLAASSEDVGFLKPSVHCFDYLLYNMGIEGLDRKEVLYVGDSYDKDVVGATKAGFTAVLVNAKGTKKEYPLACEVFESWKDFDKWLLE